MDFELTPEQQAVRELASTILTDASSNERVRGLDGWFDRDTWRQLADAGLLGIALPEDAGGAGQDLTALHLLLGEVGAAAAQVPAWETLVLGAASIDRFGDAEVRADVLPRVVAGDAVLTAALHDEDPGEPIEPRTTAVRDGGAWRVSGVKSAVPQAPIADATVVTATTDDGEVVVGLVPADGAGVTVEEQTAIDGSPHGRLVLDGAPLSAVLGGPEVLRWLLDHAAVGLASIQAGVVRAALELAADYTPRREQFGRPIATFQAVAHKVADAFIDAEAVRLTSLQAAWRLAADEPAADEVAIAQWWAAEATHRVLHAVHHVHGGVGVDREYPLHRYFLLGKRVEFALGGATPHLRSLGATLAADPV